LASVLPPAQNFVGDLEVVNIGTPCELVNATRSKTYLSECADVCRWMVQTEFSSASYKNKRGHALIVAGSSNYAGAAVLAGNAAIRSGAGLATIATPESSRTLAERFRVLAEEARALREQYREEMESVRQERESLRRAAEEA
jgi:NAD(P)H-hydrate epimerase